jgi:hypothetical protein
MIVNCGPGETMRCFKRGAETAAAPPAAAPPPAPAANAPVDYSLWGSRGDMVGAVEAILAARRSTAAAAATVSADAVTAIAARTPKMDMRRGSSRALKGYTVSPNPYTECLYREQDLWTKIAYEGGLAKLCCPSYPEGNPPPWVAMPSEGKRYQQIGSILLPAVEGTDFLVTSFAVPTGYDGVIVSVVGMFTGTGFVEGSGDLHYRIQINRRWLKDYGDTQTTMGTVASPCMIYRGGVRLRTQEVVRYWVQLGAGALGRLDPTGRLVCAFFGWFYPQV